MHILLADDDAPTREVLSAMLHQVGGYTVDAVDDGDELLKKLEGEGAANYDIVITDINMPTLNGMAATGIARHFFDATIPFIAVTSMSFTEKSFKLAEITFTHVMRKPIKMTEFLELVGRYA